MNNIKTSLPLIALASSMCIAMLAIHTTALGAQTYSCPTDSTKDPITRPKCPTQGTIQYGPLTVNLSYSDPANPTVLVACVYKFTDQDLGNAVGKLEYENPNCASHLTGKGKNSQFVFDLSYNTVMKNPQSHFSLKYLAITSCTGTLIMLGQQPHSSCSDTITNLTLNVIGDGDSTFTGGKGIEIRYENASSKPCTHCI